MTYRPDIDGLRAVAVMLVLLFHAGLGVPGGYVGVDVFFVISGYLISSIILRDLDTDRFSLSDFWVRRLRRIVPASVVMSVVTLGVGALVLFPADFEELAESAIAHPLMGSNFYFWNETDYFDGPADLKPLLHTWSLAVEEQFYLIYPLVLVGLARTSRRTMLVTLSLITAASFGVSLWGVRHAPTAAFFLLPARIWEMTLGGLLCFLPAAEKLAARWVRVLECSGAIAIAYGAVFYSASTPFPGLTAVLPCVGAALIIHAGAATTSGVRALLSKPPFVRVGLMSYSLYLWHWPILVFLRYRLGDDFTLPVRIFALALSGCVADLSWRFIETPCRQGTLSWPRRRIVLSSGFAASIPLLCGWYIQQHDGLPDRFSAEQREFLATMETPRFLKVVSLSDIAADQLPEFGDKSSEIDCLIWGDSHAMALIPALDESCRALGIHGFQATYGGTLPLIDFPSQDRDAAPEQYDEAVLDRISADDFEVVILAGYWSRDSDDPRFLPSLQETVDRLTDAGVQVVIMRDVPIQKGKGGALTVAPFQQGGDLAAMGITLDEHRRHQQVADAAFAALEGRNVTVIDPTPFFLDDTERCRIILDGECLYSDRHHLSIAGARRLKPLFLELLSTVRPPQPPDSGLPRPLLP